MAISIGSFPLLWTNPGEVWWSGTWNLWEPFEHEMSGNLADVIILEPFQNPEPFVQNLPERFMQLVESPQIDWVRKLYWPTLQGYTETVGTQWTVPGGNDGFAAATFVSLLLVQKLLSLQGDLAQPGAEISIRVATQH